MSVTSGFFNSLNHDRRYSAQQMSAIFDGIINDGVFANIGVAFAITADSGVTINIGVGKAWFNSAWVYNDALLPKTLEGSEVVLDRIDAVVIEVDHNESVRMGDIKIVKGSPSSSPKNPTLANETNKHQYPLAYIYRKAGSTEITQADITNMVGTSSCPYITGILQVQNIDNIVAQWEGQWNQWYAEKIAETDTDASELLAEMKSEFDIWFADVQALLEDDVATALAAQVAVLQGKFDTLAREGAVYDTIEDSDLDPILGSDGTPLQGKTVCGGGGNVDTSGFVTTHEFNETVNELSETVNELSETMHELDLDKLSMEPLWENGSPTSSFSGKLVGKDKIVDFEKYETFNVFAYDEASGGSLVSEYGKKGHTSRMSVARLYNPSGTKYFGIARKFTVSDDGISFTDSVVSNASSAVNDNKTLVPVYIYGVKGVS